MKPRSLRAWLVCLAVPLGLGAQSGPGWVEQRPPTFEDFPVVERFSGERAPIDLESHPQGRAYRTRLRRAAEQRPDFAGHYVMAEWGCGTSCAVHHLVDLSTGKIYDAPGASRGFDYRIDSALVVENPPMENRRARQGPPDTDPVRYWLWTGREFDLIYQQECVVVENEQTCSAATQTR